MQNINLPFQLFWNLNHYFSSSLNTEPLKSLVTLNTTAHVRHVFTVEIPYFSIYRYHIVCFSSNFFKVTGTHDIQKFWILAKSGWVPIYECNKYINLPYYLQQKFAELNICAWNQHSMFTLAILNIKYNT